MNLMKKSLLKIFPFKAPKIRSKKLYRVNWASYFNWKKIWDLIKDDIYNENDIDI
jgi:hypothetical protein